MKHLLFALLFTSLSAAAAELEVNRRNYVSLNIDSNEAILIVHYPGGSTITNVCGLQLRTNIAAFANSHTEAFLKEVELIDEDGNVLTAKTAVAEPPVMALPRKESMSVGYKLSTRSGDTLREVVLRTAKTERLTVPESPEIVVIAKHCLDQS